MKIKKETLEKINQQINDLSKQMISNETLKNQIGEINKAKCFIKTESINKLLDEQVNELKKQFDLNHQQNKQIYDKMADLANISETIKTNLNKDINYLIKKEEKNTKKAIKLVENLMLKIKKYNEIIEQKKERYTLRIGDRIDNGSWYQPKSLKSKLYEVKKWMENNNEKE